MKDQKSPLADELRALLVVRAHGEQDRVARVAGMDPRRLSNCINPDQQHTLTVDEAWAVTRAGVADGTPGFRAMLDNWYKEATKADPGAALNGKWFDEAATACRILAGTLEGHGDTPCAADLPKGAVAEITEAALQVMALMPAMLRELNK